MNEEMEKAMDALSGSGAAGGDAGGDVTDWKAKYEEAQRQLNSAKVEQGRVKKLDEEKKALEAKVAELSASRRSEAAISALPDDIREDMPENFAKGSALVAQKMVDEALASRDAELRELKAQMAVREQQGAAIARQNFAQKIGNEFPGFFRDAVLEGGDKHAAWQKYLRFNAASVTTAFNACDFDTLSWHIRNFYNTEVGIPPPSGGTGAAAPDPSPTGGGQQVRTAAGKVYTAQEYAELEKKAMQLRRMGDYDGYRKLDAELNTILTEGRVKD